MPVGENVDEVAEVRKARRRRTPDRRAARKHAGKIRRHAVAVDRLIVQLVGQRRARDSGAGSTRNCPARPRRYPPGSAPGARETRLGVAVVTVSAPAVPAIAASASGAFGLRGGAPATWRSWR